MRDLAVGSAAADIIADLLKESGYEVQPFGVENVLGPLGPKIRNDTLKSSALGHRFRSMPDLIVVSDNELVLAEVKFRKGEMKGYKVFIRFKNWEVQRYHHFWPETTIILITPHGWRFYAIPIEDLVTTLDEGDETYFELSSFTPLHQTFKSVTPDLMQAYIGRVNRLRGTGRRRQRRR